MSWITPVIDSFVCSTISSSNSATLFLRYLLNISRTVRDPLPFGLILLTQRGSFTTVIVVKLRNSSADLTVDQTVNISYLRIEFIDESSFCSLNRYFQLAT